MPAGLDAVFPIRALIGDVTPAELQLVCYEQRDSHAKAQ